jgi:hypothetical protein
VVAGGQARFAIGCDGDSGTSPERITRDFDRERELRRAGWQFWRVRQSVFERDPDAALAALWPRLATAGIFPLAATVATPGLVDAAAITPVSDGLPDADSASGAGADGAVSGAGGAGGGAGGAARGDRPAVRADVDETLARWHPIALSELEGLDDAPTRAPR